VNPPFPCAHCGATVRPITRHARLSAGSREEHDRELREADITMAVLRVTRDRDHAFDVIRRGAAARGNAFPYPATLEIERC
jgi:hypothetical protein